MDDLLFGIQVAVLGMAMVFGLLALLWGLLTLVLRVERRAEARAAARGAPAADGAAADRVKGQPAAAIAPDADVGSVSSSAPPGGVRLVGAPLDLDPRLVAAVGVVVLRHAETRRRQAAPAMRSYWPGSLLFASRWVAAGRTRQARSWTRRAR